MTPIAGMKDVRVRFNPLHDVRCLTAADQTAARHDPTRRYRRE